MKTHLLNPDQENLWDNFVQTHPHATIHQSSTWGLFQSRLPSRGKYWIIAITEEADPISPQNPIIGGTLLVKYLLPKNYSWLYAPRGPLFSNPQNPQQETDLLLEAITPIAQEENAIFFRIDPPIEARHAPLKLTNFKPVKYGFQPQNTLILNINQSNENILAQMKPKGRYNIKLATKKDVKIHKSNPKKPEDFAQDIEAFYELLEDTTKRDQFSAHDQKYYIQMVETLSQTNLVDLFIATVNHQPIAGIMVTYFKDTATYYYGASSNEHRNLMAPYLLHWEAIKEAKSRKLTQYDFFGIAPSNAKKHPWKGVTDFKKKFGGHEVSYHLAQEYSFKKFLHTLYKIYKK